MSCNWKVINRNDIAALAKSLKQESKSIAFTNGCFDILHSGHVRYLTEAKKRADILMVGLNSNASVKRLKGQERPVNDEIDRAIVLAALEAVDYVVVFDEDTPYELISQIIPDVLVKGGDWKEEDIVGADVVKQNGGKVISLSFYAGKSSTEIIERIISVSNGAHR